MQAVVKGLRRPTPDVITALSREYAAAADQAAFAELLTAALKQLHEGSVARYRLRRSEFLAWMQVRDGWSMEQEIRQILQQTVAPEQMAREGFAQRVHERFAGFNLAALPIPDRKPARRPPGFGKA